MSSNKRIQKVCPVCDKPFIAKQINTQFCSDRCRHRRLYTDFEETKTQAYEFRNTKIDKPKTSKVRITSVPTTSSPTQPDEPKELIDAKELASITGLSISTIFRIIKKPGFPQVKIGRLLRFHKASAVGFIVKEYSLAISGKTASG